MKTLCLFTNEFPYGTWEPYMETEVKYYEPFDKVYIFALQLRSEHAKTRRKLPKNCKVIPVRYAPKWVYLLNAIKTLTDKNLYRELKELKKTKRLGLSQLVSLFVYISRSHYEADKIHKIMKNVDLGETVFYSYRFEYQPYVAMLLKKRWKKNVEIVARGHRYDLYEQFRGNKYIPFRKILLEGIDNAYPCSNSGTEYLRELFPEYKDKIEPRFLGTTDRGTQQYEKGDTFRMVSCSNMVPVKRIDKIIDALSCIKDQEITWTHFGEGILFEEMKEKAKQLPANVHVDFRGNVQNRVLLEEYKKNIYDLFINVSESEGIPVSIMEAMSFGIPCLATNAGGTGEIVQDGETGTIIPVESSPTQVAECIGNFMNMEEDEYLMVRKMSKKKWSEKFNADNNYTQFVKELVEKTR